MTLRGLPVDELHELLAHEPVGGEQPRVVVRALVVEGLVALLLAEGERPLDEGVAAREVVQDVGEKR